ncbi:hypothetical protein ABZY58_11415 [Micromonospora tulbaghiae]|uniref:hypothetical protein n=1 Tax=Micromonospora tulbaghiae TaxID=479978 RepID=UPI0033B749CA
MSVKSMRQAADNRAAHNQAQINAQTSPLAALRRALEWVMSEARSMSPADVPAVTTRITRVARDMNERSRP